MIKFDEKRKLFSLYNKEFSYYFYINKLGYLIHLYSGEYLSDLDIERLTERYSERYAYLDNDKETCDESYYFSLQASNFECSGFNTADKRGYFAIIKNSDNSLLTDFRYVKHEIVYGKKTIKGLPHARIENAKNVETLIISLKDVRSEVYLELYYSIFDDLNILIRNSKIINKTGSSINLLKLSSMQVDFPYGNYNLISTYGTWSKDRQLEETRINHNKIIISDNHGARGFYHNPSIIIKEKDTNLFNGSAYIFSLVYSGNFSFEVGQDELGQTRLICGINDENFYFAMPHNTSFTAPECVMSFSSQGINGATHHMHDFVRNYILPKTFALKERPILINSWEAYYFDFDTNKIISLIEEAKKLGIELVVLDDGWFGKRSDDKTSLGDWNINLEKIDLKKVIDYAHSNKMKFGIWVEPEMISPDSALFRNHPEFALYNRNIKPTLFRHQLPLDLTNPKVVDFIYESISKIFRNYKIDYCKWDFNRYLSEIGSLYLGKDKEGEIYHRFILGSYKLLENFVNEFPNVLLETCASGGGRFDLGMLYYSPQIWGSDETDPTARVEIQYSTNFFYPLSTIGAHVSARPYLTYQDKAIISAFGTFGYELDPLKLSKEDKDKIIEINKLIKEWHHVVTLGDYYALKSPIEGNYASWMVVSKNKREALVFHFNFRREPTYARYIKLYGLDPDLYYFNSLTNTIYKGEFYLRVDLNISAPLNEGTTMLFILKAVNYLEKTIFEKKQMKNQQVRDKIF